MATPYFPVDLSAMSAKRKFKEVAGGEEFTIHGAKVVTRWLNHPQGCLGYRIETPAATWPTPRTTSRAAARSTKACASIPAAREGTSTAPHSRPEHSATSGAA